METADWDMMGATHASSNLEGCCSVASNIVIMSSTTSDSPATLGGDGSCDTGCQGGEALSLSSYCCTPSKQQQAQPMLAHQKPAPVLLDPIEEHSRGIMKTSSRDSWGQSAEALISRSDAERDSRSGALKPCLSLVDKVRLWATLLWCMVSVQNHIQ